LNIIQELNIKIFEFLPRFYNFDGTIYSVISKKAIVFIARSL